MAVQQVPLTERATLKVEEAAALLGLSVPTVYRLVHVEGFPSFQVGNRWVISRKRLFEWVDQQAGKEYEV